MNQLSPTMRSVLQYMRKHDNTICRYPGGFWAHSKWKSGEFSYGTSTINALELRGEIEWTALQQRSGGLISFPIEARIVRKEAK